MAHHDVAFEVHYERTAGTPRALDQTFRMLERMQVRTADPAREGLYQRFTRTRFRRCDIGDDQLLVAHHGGTHVSSLRNQLAICSPARSSLYTSELAIAIEILRS